MYVTVADHPSILVARQAPQWHCNILHHCFVLFNIDLTNKVIVMLRHEIAHVCSVSLNKIKQSFYKVVFLFLVFCLYKVSPLLLNIRYEISLIFVDPYIIAEFIKENPTRCNNVSHFYNFIFIWSSTCFGRHTTHHQEPKTVLAASGFS